MPKNFKWFDNEVRDLIANWAEHSNALSSNRRNRPIYEKIALNLNASFNETKFNANEVSVKISTLKKQYRKHRADMTTGSNRTTWSYYDLIHPIEGQRATNNVNIISDSLRGSQPEILKDSFTIEVTEVPTPIAPQTTEEDVDLSFESDFPQVQPTSALNPHSPQPGPAPKSVLPSSHSIALPKKKRRPSGSSKVDDLITVVMQKLSDTDNKFTNFGKMVADELVNMKTENALLVKNLIAEALHIGSLGLITPEHFIALSKKDGGALKCDKEWMSMQENVKKRKRADFETPLHEPSLKISAVKSLISDSEFFLPDIQASITDSSVTSQSLNGASVSVVDLSSFQDQAEDSQFVRHTTRPPSIGTEQDKLQEASDVAHADPGGTPDEKTIQSQEDISVPPDKGRITEGSKIIDTTSIELLDKNDLTTDPSQSLLTSVEDLQKGQPDPIGTRATKTLISGWCLDDECSDFARIVAGKLRKMKDFERCITEKIICEALFLGSTGALSPSAHLVNE